ncbi:hypothetical protein Sru01_36790 [Sphaerisporangium rufum]|uniref:GtrA/DPMS transmembrane domain-containing protein n=1 Tax=Sphaerisporangium rufum TaxID=1381558 RepID=A0A919R7M4_9ACTN|nr:GtrA family protein [Sphaerisporangium rufum]GII78697.1 hypothetical protein Sru01_36790 [Sphaerisporangium rufum]
MRHLTPALGGHLITYLVSGGVTALLYYAILAAGLHIFRDSVSYLCVVVASHFITLVAVYPWYRLVVFRGGRKSWIAGYLRFYAVGLGFLACSLAGLPPLVGAAHLPVLAAQAVVLVGFVPLNYLTHRFWTFRDRRRDPGKDMT